MPLRSWISSRRPGATAPKVMLYEFASALCAMAFVIAYRVRIRGAAQVPASGPCLLAANHESFFDPPLIGTFVRSRHLSFVARIGLFKFKPFAWLISALNALSINDGGSDTAAIKEVLRRLGAGHAVLIFPEGARTPDGQLQEFKRGVALLVSRARCPVVPVAVAGCYRAWSIHDRFPKLRAMPVPFGLFWGGGQRLAVVYGKPIAHEELMKDGPDAALARLRAEIERLSHEAAHLARTESSLAHTDSKERDAPASSFAHAALARVR